MSELNKQTIDRLMEIGAQGVPVEMPDGGDAYVLAPSTMQALDVSKFYPPTRIKAVATFTDPGSFAEYVNRFKTSASLIFAKVTDAGAWLEAVLDYHQPGPEGQARAAHRAKYACETTAEWNAWLAANGKRMDQVEFATWLEENQELIVEPAGADLLEFVQHLEAAGGVRFNSYERLKNGAAKVLYEEDTVVKGANTTKLGEIEVPSMIVAAISPFHGIPYKPVSARLKYRISERKITFWFETVAAHRIVREAVASLVAEVATKTELQPLLGSVVT